MAFEIWDAVRDVPYCFRPVVHLRTGGIMALEVHACRSSADVDHVRSVTSIAQRSIRLDVGFAAEAVRRAAKHGTQLPLHLRLWADTVCAEHDPLGPLLDTLASLGREPEDVVIRLLAPRSEPVPRHIETGLARLRAAGLGFGLDVAGTYPMTTLIDAQPEVLFLAAKHLRGLPAVPAARAALATSVELAGQTGATLIADGCDTAEQAAALRARGVYRVQGRLLGPPRHRPHTEPIQAVVLHQRTTVPATDPDAPAWPDAPQGPDHAAKTDSERLTVAADLAFPAATMPADTTGETARAVFADQPHLASLVLVDEHQHPLLALHRDRFMIAFTGPFGYSLYAKRPAAGLADPPRLVGLQTSVTDVIEVVANAPAGRVYDDLVLIDAGGRCVGMVRISDVFRECAQRQAHPTARSGGPPWAPRTQQQGSLNSCQQPSC